MTVFAGERPVRDSTFVPALMTYSVWLYLRGLNRRKEAWRQFLGACAHLMINKNEEKSHSTFALSPQIEDMLMLLCTTLSWWRDEKLLSLQPSWLLVRFYWWLFKVVSGCSTHLSLPFLGGVQLHVFGPVLSAPNSSLKNKDDQRYSIKAPTRSEQPVWREIRHDESIFSFKLVWETYFCSLSFD